jgi:hypothetical protein
MNHNFSIHDPRPIDLLCAAKDINFNANIIKFNDISLQEVIKFNDISLQEVKQKVDDIYLMINEIYYSPGMPGSIAAENSFNDKKRLRTSN